MIQGDEVSYKKEKEKQATIQLKFKLNHVRLRETLDEQRTVDSIKDDPIQPKVCMMMKIVTKALGDPSNIVSGSRISEPGVN